MTFIPEAPPPTLWPVQTVSIQAASIDREDERLNRAQRDLLKEDQWINEFIKHLNFTINDIAGRK
jgi:hypothetical protein